MSIRILIADDNSAARTAVAEYFRNRESFEVVGEAEDGYETINMIASQRPDVVLLDLIMPRMDGISVLKTVKSMVYKPRIIVLSELGGDEHVNMVCGMGADYYLIKPVEWHIIEERILSFFLVREHANAVVRQQALRGTKNFLDEKVSNIFITVGIPAHIKGYQFLREAVKMAIDKPEIISAITKQIYPGVACKFSTSPSKVERAIRHAIEVAWSRGKIENINTLFGIKVYTGNEKPTNGEFIALVADKLLIEGNCV